MVWAQLPQAVQGQIETFADADSSGADEQEGVGHKIIGAAQFLLQALILLERKGAGQIAGLWREVLATDEVGLNGVTVGGQILEQPPEINEMVEAGYVAQGWLLFAQRTKPTEEMGIAAELRDSANLWESSTKIGEETACRRSIVVYRVRPQGEGERLDPRLEDLFEVESRGLHERCPDLNFLRFSMVRAYSLQTSCGASWT
jgi:hypothetical protein